MKRCWHTYEPGLPRTSVLSSPMNVLESKEIDQRTQDRPQEADMKFFQNETM